MKSWRRGEQVEWSAVSVANGICVGVPVPLDTFLHYALGLLEEHARTQEEILDVHLVRKRVVLDQMLEQLV